MSDDRLDRRREEFMQHVWDHSTDQFQKGFDEPPLLTRHKQELLASVFRLLLADRSNRESAHMSRRNLTGELLQLLMPNPDGILILLQVVGSTRNKILQDLKPALRRNRLRIPSTAPRLVTNPDAWSLAGPYLIGRLGHIFEPLFPLSEDALPAAFEALNRSTWPGWIRQERAKRSGHEAERRLASLLQSLDLSFQPVEKAENPLCRDATIEGVSFDLVVPSVTYPRLCVKATVHTANIGQYGESKDNLEVQQAATLMARLQPSPKLLAFVDGIGFESNRSGRDGVLSTADEFCQFKTIWKAGVLAAEAHNRQLQLALSDPDRHQDFINRYSRTINLVHYTDDVNNWIEAGEARLRAL